MFCKIKLRKKTKMLTGIIFYYGPLMYSHPEIGIFP